MSSKSINSFSKKDSSRSSSLLSSSASPSSSSSPSNRSKEEAKRKPSHHHSNSSHKRGTSKRSRSRSRSRSIKKAKNQLSYDQPKKSLNSTITVVVKPVERIKGRGTLRREHQGGLLAWEEDDYLLNNKKLIDSGAKFKSFSYENNYKPVFYSKTEDKGGRRNWRHDKYTIRSNSKDSKDKNNLKQDK